MICFNLLPTIEELAKRKESVLRRITGNACPSLDPEHFSGIHISVMFHSVASMAIIPVCEGRDDLVCIVETQLSFLPLLIVVLTV